MFDPHVEFGNSSVLCLVNRTGTRVIAQVNKQHPAHPYNLSFLPGGRSKGRNSESNDFLGRNAITLDS